jgi:hypothetical protein
MACSTDYPSRSTGSTRYVPGWPALLTIGADQLAVLGMYLDGLPYRLSEHINSQYRVMYLDGLPYRLSEQINSQYRVMYLDGLHCQQAIYSNAADVRHVQSSPNAGQSSPASSFHNGNHSPSCHSVLWSFINFTQNEYPNSSIPGILE